MAPGSPTTEWVNPKCLNLHGTCVIRKPSRRGLASRRDTCPACRSRRPDIPRRARPSRRRKTPAVARNALSQASAGHSDSRDVHIFANVDGPRLSLASGFQWFGRFRQSVDNFYVPCCSSTHAGAGMLKTAASWPLGDRLMVGQRTLTPPVRVRILLPQPAATLDEVSQICPSSRLSRARRGPMYSRIVPVR